MFCVTCTWQDRWSVLMLDHHSPSMEASRHICKSDGNTCTPATHMHSSTNGGYSFLLRTSLILIPGNLNVSPSWAFCGSSHSPFQVARQPGWGEWKRLIMYSETPRVWEHVPPLCPPTGEENGLWICQSTSRKMSRPPSSELWTGPEQIGCDLLYGFFPQCCLFLCSFLLNSWTAVKMLPSWPLTWDLNSFHVLLRELDVCTDEALSYFSYYLFYSNTFRTYFKK